MQHLTYTHWVARRLCRRKVVKFREVLDQMFTSVTAMDFGSSLNPSPSAAVLTAAAADGRLRPATAATADSEVRARAMSALLARKRWDLTARYGRRRVCTAHRDDL